MALIDLCEKLLAYLCRLNRLGRTRATNYPEAGEVRTQIMSMLGEIKAKAPHEVYTPAIEEALWATADWLVKGSRLPWAEAAWTKRGFDPHADRYDLDEVFYNHLEATLAESPSEARDQRLEVFAACIGLGYVGKYIFERDRERAEGLEREMRRIWGQIKDRQHLDERGRITPATYDATLEDDLRPPRVPGTVRYAVLLAVMIVGLVAAQVLLFNHARQSLRDAVGSIQQAPEGKAAPGRAEGARP
jgi:type VI protein secretion system component VasF